VLPGSERRFLMLKRIIEKIFCLHQYKKIEAVETKQVNVISKESRVVEYTFIYQCSICGKIRKVKV
jgi:hypothetical protein